MQHGRSTYANAGAGDSKQALITAYFLPDVCRAYNVVCRGLVGGESHIVRADDLVGGCLACKVRWCEYHERCATNGCNPGAVIECDCDGGPVRVRPTK